MIKFYQPEDQSYPIPVCGMPWDEGAISQILTCAKRADFAALMADHHKGYAVPIGGVVAYKNAISPSHSIAKSNFYPCFA